MILHTQPLCDAVGVEVIGLDATQAIPASVQRELYDIFIRHGVLLFRGAGISAEAHLRVSRCFGELERHPVKESWIEGSPELIDISYVPPPPGTLSANQPVYEVDGQQLAGWLPWHTDQCFMPALSRGGVIRAIQTPQEGGHTGFRDKIALYASLPDHLKDRIADLSVIYRFQPQATLHKFGRPKDLKLVSSSSAMDSILARLDRDFPPAVHPLVYAQTETGRKVLNLSPAYATGIEGMENPEGDALLEELVAHCLQPGAAYHHDWQNGDLVAWDNWRIMHNAEGTPPYCTRLVQRTSIKGDYGLGRRFEPTEQRTR
jgi:taurine dioxygenase